MNDALKTQPKARPYPEPDYVKFWNAHPGMPRCCFLCHHFANPMCQKYRCEVPLNFANSLDACPSWIDDQGIPF